MNAIAKLSGFFAAHGIWGVSDGDTLIPMLGYEDTQGKGGMERIVTEDVAEAVEMGRGTLREGREGWARAVLVFDGYLRRDEGRTDALFVDAVEYLPQRQSMMMAVPYRPPAASNGFAVYRPKFMEVPAAGEADLAGLAESFFAGVDSHEHGAAVWNAHLLDESV